MRPSPAYLLPVLAFAAVTTVCSRGNDSAPAVATPSLALSDAAAIGSPIEMTYRFAVADDAPAFTEDYWVFVHFLDTDGELMWTDDHEPPTPTRQWTPGATVEYPRVMFVPKFPYVGPTGIEIGLFSPTTGDRLPMAGETTGQRSYRVATFDMRLQSDNLFVVFRDGWHDVEAADDFAGPQWQWSSKDATLTFPNPNRDVRVYLQVDQPAPRPTCRWISPRRPRRTAVSRPDPLWSIASSCRPPRWSFGASRFPPVSWGPLRQWI